MATDFIVGQRWISNTEPELGLGLIIDVSTHRVSVSYLATGDKRIYAQDNAPLTRVLFSVGDWIESDANVKIKVQAVIEHNGIITYIGHNQADDECRLEEMALNCHTQFNNPQDRLFNGQIDPSAWFLLRYETWHRQFQQHKSPIKGLQGARVSLIAHQLYIANEIAKRFKPRAMLADEVGLGKTIEAGLILQYRLINGLSQRLLIIVPDNLLHQWLVEMLRRFNIRFSLFDELRCSAINEPNPFISEQCVLCSQDFLRDNPHRQQQILQADWDMVVIDEAHHLTQHKQQPDSVFWLIEQLASSCLGLILLTATPEQLGKENHFAQLRLLDPDRFYQFQQYVAEEALFAPIAAVSRLLIDGAPINKKHQSFLNRLLKQEHVASLLEVVNDTSRMAKARTQLIALLLDHHGTGRILFRNSRQTVQGFPSRKSIGYPLTQDTSTEDESPYFEWLWKTLIQLQNVQQKALLICRHAKTVIQLEKALKTRKGIATAVFHEGMSIVARDRAAAYFADEDSRVVLLMCSEMGSEGRNFQCAHHLILFDLPTNPDLLQQRIGRLDRIGQKNSIQIHIPYVLNTPQHLLFRWYEEGFNLFQHNSFVAVQVAVVLQNQLTDLLNNYDLPAIDKLIATTQQLHKKLSIEAHYGRDRLLELNACKSKPAQALIEQITNIDNSDALWRYMQLLFACYGVDIEPHSDDCYILKPNENLRGDYFPLISADGMTVTTNRDIALAREDFQFITHEHPLVISAMDLVCSSNNGNAAICVIGHPQLHAGQFLLELLFIVECSAPAVLRVSQYLPHTPIRILIDQNQHNISAQISHQDMRETNALFEEDKIIHFINHQKKHITAMIATAKADASQQMEGIIAESNTQMRQDLKVEIRRLQQLKKINASIKTEEIEALKRRLVLATQHINKAQLKLDAVRFVIIGCNP